MRMIAFALKRGKQSSWAILSVTAFILGLSYSAFAEGAIQLPQTGQTTCYNVSTGSAIDCTSTSAIGQDGSIRAGVVWPSPRFTKPDGAVLDSGATIVLDRLTGLQWSRDGNPHDYWCEGGTLGALNWAGALNQVGCLNYDHYQGYNDWRLPNILELASLLNKGAPDTAAWLMSQGFTNVSSAGYWSSTTDAFAPSTAWVVNNQGSVLPTNKMLSSTYVWIVRGQPGPSDSIIQLPKTGQTTCYDSSAPVSCASTGGQDGNTLAGAAWPIPRFTVNNGTVKDNLTGLIWLRNANCANATMTLPDALTWVGNLNSGDCGLSDGSEAGDWRLPNTTEMLSLVDFESSYPALSNTDGTDQMTVSGEPFSNVKYANVLRYLSSTLAAYMPKSSFTFYLQEGYMLGNATAWPTGDVPALDGYIWPVYDGRRRLVTALSGSGIVIPDCSDGCWFQKNSTVPLTAVPDSGSAFVWWTGACSGTNAVTSVSMDSSKTCTAVFSSCSGAPIEDLQNGVTFTAAQGIQYAYNDTRTCSGGRQDTIALVPSSFTEQLSFNLDKDIILQGAWNCGFIGRWGSPAFIIGSVSIGSGSVVFDNIVIL